MPHKDSQVQMTIDELNQYDNIVVCFSGGKDSQACYLHLLDLGVSPNKIELWHHRVDGNEGSGLMDWPVTDDYCRKFAETFGSKIYYSWKVGGFEGEMLRENSKTQPTKFEVPGNKVIQVGGIRGKESTRRKFPQVSPDLSVRWCSAYLKIDICRMAISNQDRFQNKKTLVVTGERAEESPGRAKYNEFEVHATDKRESKRLNRHVDQWRPVHKWSEQEIWDIIRKFDVNPHPAYRAGWGRLSCASCIFGSNNQWASVKKVLPESFEKIAEYENEFGLTIHREKNVTERANEGEAYQAINDEIKTELRNETFTSTITVNEWTLPAGAFGESNGPV